MARIDRLPEEARRLAQVAAVVGRAFPAARARAGRAAGREFESALSVLLRAQFIRELRRDPQLDLHLQARAAAGGCALDADAGPATGAVRQGRGGLRGALRRLARRVPRDPRALLRPEPGPREGAASTSSSPARRRRRSTRPTARASSGSVRARWRPSSAIDAREDRIAARLSELGYARSSRGSDLGDAVRRVALADPVVPEAVPVEEARVVAAVRCGRSRACRRASPGRASRASTRSPRRCRRSSRTAVRPACRARASSFPRRPTRRRCSARSPARRRGLCAGPRRRTAAPSRRRRARTASCPGSTRRVAPAGGLHSRSPRRRARWRASSQFLKIAFGTTPASPVTTAPCGVRRRGRRPALGVALVAAARQGDREHRRRSRRSQGARRRARQLAAGERHRARLARLGGRRGDLRSPRSGGGGGSPPAAGARRSWRRLRPPRRRREPRRPEREAAPQPEAAREVAPASPGERGRSPAPS